MPNEQLQEMLRKIATADEAFDNEVTELLENRSRLERAISRYENEPTVSDKESFDACVAELSEVNAKISRLRGDEISGELDDSGGTAAESLVLKKPKQQVGYVAVVWHVYRKRIEQKGRQPSFIELSRAVMETISQDEELWGVAPVAKRVNQAIRSLSTGQ